MLLDEKGLWVRGCPTFFVFDISFRIFLKIITEKKFWVLTFLYWNMAVILIQFRFIFSLLYVKIFSFALPKKTDVPAKYL